MIHTEGIEYGADSLIGIIPIKILEGIFPSEVQLTHLEYVVEEPSDSEIPELALNVKNKLYNRQTGDVSIGDEDPECAIDSLFVNMTLSKINEYSLKHKIEIIDKEGINLDLNRSSISRQDTTDMKWNSMFSKRLLSKILACGNIIVRDTRRGPSNFIIISDKYARYISILTRPANSIYRLGCLANICGMKVFMTSDDTDTVVVGRCGAIDEGGLTLVLPQDSKAHSELTNVSSSDGNELHTFVKFDYVLSDGSDNAYLNYMQFDIV